MLQGSSLSNADSRVRQTHTSDSDTNMTLGQDRPLLIEAQGTGNGEVRVPSESSPLTRERKRREAAHTQLFFPN